MRLKYFLAAATTVIVSVHGVFDCNRDITQCLNTQDDCTRSSGDCNCAAGFSGKDCGIDNNEVDASPCVPGTTCQNGGTCTGDGASTSACHCTEMYYDTDCSKERYELTCTGTTSMELIIKPHLKDGTTFTGEIFVKGKQSTAGCKFTEASGLYTLQLDHTGSACGDVTPDGNGVYERQFEILFTSTTVQASYDELIIASCGSTDVLTKSVTAVTVGNIDANVNTQGVGAVPTDGDVDFVLTDTSDTALGVSIDLGTDVKACAKLSASGLQKFQAIRLEDCYADNDDATNSLTYNLVITKCPVVSGLMLADPDLVGNAPAVEICFTFDAFKFTGPGGNDVKVTCDVKACKTAADCAPADCSPGTANGFGRKKRQAEQGTSETKILAQIYQIRDPSATEAQTNLTTSSCIMTTEVTASIVALAVALLLVIILAIILFCVVLSRRRKEALYRDNTSVSTTTSHAYANHLPTLVSEK